MPRDRDLEREVIIALAPLIGLNIGVQVNKGIVYLRGAVSSLEEKRQAERLVSEVPGTKRVVNELIIDPTGYQGESQLEDRPHAEVVDALELEDIDLGEQDDTEPSFMGPVGPTDVTETEDVVEFFPPTDPVVHGASREQQGMELRNAWAPTSMTRPTEPENEPEHFEHSDYEILENVIQALRDDASTQDLNIQVSVHDSIVHLHGTVPSLDDADNAEAVAAGVDGVLEVVEALNIEEPYIREA